jgi:hypothetical protein
MPFKNNNPGCCCACVADASHVCLCSCLDAFPRTLHTSDSLGALSLGYAGGGVWQQARNLTGQTTYCWTTICNTFAGQTITVIWKLTLNCTTGWKFEVIYQVSICPGGPFGFVWSGCPNFANVAPSGSIPFTCDFSLLEFTLPTTQSGFGVPGGGGYYAITP